VRCWVVEARNDAGSELLDIPVEWSSRSEAGASLARNALNALLRSSLAGGGGRPGEKLLALWRWAVPALLGDLGARGFARLEAWHARAVLLVLTVAGSSEAIARWMRRYIAALIRLQRLDCIHRLGRDARSAGGLLGGHVIAQIGFHAEEFSAGHIFRWSEPEAAVRIKGMPGRTIVRVRSPALRAPLDTIDTRFYVDGTPVAPAAVVTDYDSYTLKLDLPPSGIATLAWACPVFRGVGDSRRLGLPVAGIDVGDDMIEIESAGTAPLLA